MEPIKVCDINERDQWIYRFWLDQIQRVIDNHEGRLPGLPWLEHWRAS